MYYGRTKLKVVKDALSMELKRKRNFQFIQSNSISFPDLNTPFVYFPMNVVEEYNLLHYAPFYTDQIEVIRHITKSIPIDYVVYVKEHGGSKIRGWNSIDYYKKILEIPNVVMIHPNTDNDMLMENSKLVVTLRGISALKAIKYGKPLIVFGEIPFQILPSVFTVDSLNDLPILVQNALNHKVDSQDYEKYEKMLDSKTFECNGLEYHIRRNKAFFSGGILSNVPIHEKDMTKFLDENKILLSGLVDAHLKIISQDDVNKPLK